MIKLLRKLFQNVPRDYVKLPMKGLVAVNSHNVGGDIYDEFRYEDHPGIRLIVRATDGEIVSLYAGKHFITF